LETLKIPLGRPRNGWENFRMDLRDIAYGSMDWIYLGQERD
jgi:hypothetical protein